MIARRGRRFVSRGTRGRRRKLVWARFSIGPTSTGIAPTNVFTSDLLADYESVSGGGSLNGATVMRVRGLLTCVPQSTSNADSVMGIGIKVEDRLDVTLPGAEQTARRGPLTTDRYGNWMAREYWHQQTGIVATGTVFADSSRQIDVRARRKLDEAQSTLVLIAELQSIGTGLWHYQANLDILLALP